MSKCVVGIGLREKTFFVLMVPVCVYWEWEGRSRLMSYIGYDENPCFDRAQYWVRSFVLDSGDVFLSVFLGFERNGDGICFLD